jgi:hypothetical protein
MIKKLTAYLFPVIVMILHASTAKAQLPASGIDPEAIIERLLAVAEDQRERLVDVVFEAEYIEGEQKKDQGFVEKIRLEKKTYLKFFQDTALYHEEYLAYYKDGELKDRKDLEKEAKDRKEKRKAQDLSFPILSPFYTENRQDYEIMYRGVAEEKIGSHICHHFEVTSKIEEANHINGDYYFEAESFHLVRVDFSPAKLVKKTLFKLKQLNMSINYGPTVEGFWLPKRFDIDGKGKAMFFIGVKFSATEYYRNPIINNGISDAIFEVSDDN